MTRDDKLFDIKYVVFDADDVQSQMGKNVFVSDSLINLRNAVNRMDTDNSNYYGQLVSVDEYASGEAEFKIDCNSRTYKLMYNDPYYEFKCAFKRGETIEHNCRGAGVWITLDAPNFDDMPERYRIKSNKPVLKWQDLKIGDIIRGPFMNTAYSDDSIYSIVTMIDTDSRVDKHIHAGHFWIADEDLCKFRRVNEHGEDIE